MADEPIPYSGPVVTWSAAKAAGALRYFTAAPCRRGHISERYVSGRKCINCGLLFDPDKNRECQARYREANRQKTRTASLKWHAENRERGKANNSRWRRANVEKTREYGRKWRNNSPDKHHAATSVWAKANRKNKSVNQARRKAKKLASVGDHTPADVKRLFDLQKGKCAHSWCRKPIANGYHVDHIVPLFLGGSNGRANLQLLCPTCNIRKGAKDPIVWAQRNGQLL